MEVLYETAGDAIPNYPTTGKDYDKGDTIRIRYRINMDLENDTTIIRYK